MTCFVFTRIESPLGPLTLVRDRIGLCGINFPRNGQAAAADRDWQEDGSAFDDTIRQLRAYFAGEQENFDLPLAPQGTPFQQRVWRELCRIPYGQTISYGELARRIGNPQASRAVGLANGSNPIPIIIPCHRVIGANGKLTGYGGGLPIKEKLLALEKRQLTLL
ncbi:MAG TPA: methylated-DNA--[protein]-cysteine S-methyltransferase [Terriglobales bacterium]|nr:methylated-DNA--[protein]-cysteine S-methyltransferase [Terriglobales bacterium]